MKKLNWYDIFETTRIVIDEEDLKTVEMLMEDDIELYYNQNTLKVFNEAGEYVADILSIKEDF